MAAPLWIQNLFNAIGGVVAKVANNGSAVAPDSTTTQVILDFTGATTTYTPPGVGETLGKLHVPLDTGSGTEFIPDTPLSLVAGHLTIGAATAGARGTMSGVDKAKHDLMAEQLTGNTTNARLEGSTSSVLEVDASDIFEATATAVSAIGVPYKIYKDGDYVLIADVDTGEVQLGDTTAPVVVQGTTARLAATNIASIDVGGSPAVETDGEHFDEIVRVRRWKFDSSGYRNFEYEANACLQLTNTAVQSLPTISAVEYQGNGSLVAGHGAEMVIEVTLTASAFDHSGGGGTLSSTGVTTRGTWVFTWNKVSPLPSGPTGSWNHTNVGEDTARHIGSDWATDMGISVSLDHSGPEDGTITVQLNHNTGAWATGQDWSTAKFNIKITGGGRYAI